MNATTYASLELAERQKLDQYAQRIAKDYLLKNVGNSGEDSTAPHIRDYFLDLLFKAARPLISVDRINGRVSFSHDSTKMDYRLFNTFHGTTGQFTPEVIEKCSKIFGNRARFAN